MTAVKLILAALALGGLAAPAAASPVVRAAPAGDLDRLVRLLVPDAAMLDLAMKALDGNAPPALAGDAATRAHVAARVRPEVQRLLARELPSLRPEIAAILTAELTQPEIAEATTFFASPTGQKVYAAAIASIAAKPGMTEDQAREAAMNAAIASLAPEDYPAMIAFAASGASAKMGAINPRVSAASKAWAARLAERDGERIRALQLRAAEDYRKRGSNGQ